jgi:hypothetical protein
VIRIWLCLAALPVIAAECSKASGEYEGYRVSRVSVETPLSFPVAWVESLLLGRAIRSLESVVQGLPVQAAKPFRFKEHVATMEELKDRYNVLRPGERVRLTFVVPKLINCDDAGRAIEVVYRVYTSDAAYYASRIFENDSSRVDRRLTVGQAAETNGTMQALPFLGYNRTRRLFGGTRASWDWPGAAISHAEMEAGGSSSSHRAGFAFSGARDPQSGLLSHLDWRVGYRQATDPAAELELRESTAVAQFFGATRALGSLGLILRFGTSLEGGYRQTNAGARAPLADAPHRAAKAFLGGTWNYQRHVWTASYGQQLARGTETSRVHYSKHVADLGYQARWLPREHYPVRLDARINGGWISGDPNRVPLAERFFGGNLSRPFIEGSLWQIPAGPLIRSIPQNRLYRLGADLGATSFVSANFTAAAAVWRLPAIPAVVRQAKELGDVISIGLQETRDASLQDYRARRVEFTRVLAGIPKIESELKLVRDRVAELVQLPLPGELIESLQLAPTMFVEPITTTINETRQRQSTGVAWVNCRNLVWDRLAESQVTSLVDEITRLRPELQNAGRGQDAEALGAAAARLQEVQKQMVAGMEEIERLVALDAASLSAFDADLDELRSLTQNVLGELEGTADGQLRDRLKAVDSNLGTDPDPVRVLFSLDRLATGVGKLVLPQLVSAADALEQAGRKEQAVQFRKIYGRLVERMRKLRRPPGERWAAAQNAYIPRAMDVAFREMNLAAVSPVLLFDVARLGATGQPSLLRYGLGGGMRLSIVSMDLTLGYAANMNGGRRRGEGRGALFVSMDVADLFR